MFLVHIVLGENALLIYIQTSLTARKYVDLVPWNLQLGYEEVQWEKI